MAPRNPREALVGIFREHFPARPSSSGENCGGDTVLGRGWGGCWETSSGIPLGFFIYLRINFKMQRIMSIISIFAPVVLSEQLCPSCQSALLFLGKKYYE